MHGIKCMFYIRRGCGTLPYIRSVILVAFRFDKLWVMLEERNMSREQLCIAIRSSQSAVVNMDDNKNVNLDIIDSICTYLQCSADDIMEFIPNENLDIIAKTKIEYGGVYLCGLPYGEVENNPAASRLAICIQANELCKQAPFVYVAPLLDRMVTGPFSIFIEKTEENGLAHDSTIALSQIRTLRSTMLYVRLGRLSDADTARLNDSIVKIFGVQ